MIPSNKNPLRDCLLLLLLDEEPNQHDGSCEEYQEEQSVDPGVWLVVEEEQWLHPMRLHWY